MITNYFSSAVRLPTVEEGDRVLTIDELAQQFRVSRKTVSRWRRRGLVGRRLMCDGHLKVGFLQSCVDRFVADNAEPVRRSTRFCRLTDEERQHIVERARLLVQAGEGRTEIISRIALAAARSHETIRYTLNRYDREHPDEAIFPYNHGPMPSDTKRQIVEEHQRGEAVDALARRFGQTCRGIRRIMDEVRAARIMELPLECIDNEQFPLRSSEARAREILGPPPESDLANKKPRLPSGLPAYLASLYEVPLLTREEEAHQFRKMNYLKHMARKLRDTLVLDRLEHRLMDRIERLYGESLAIKNQIISANLRLVVSIAKRYVGESAEFFELVSDGNLSLMRAVEKFDVSRGNVFSTYATWAIVKNYARSIPVMIRHRDRFSTSHSDIFRTTVDLRADQYEQESAQLRRETHVKKILRCLNERELQIVAGRFGLTRGQAPLTLKQVGAVMGVSKERIRQVQTRALVELRKTSEEERFEDDLASARNSPREHDTWQSATKTGGDQ